MAVNITLDGVEVSYEAVAVISKYKNILESINDLASDPEGRLDKVLREDVLPKDLELMTAFADMTIAINNFKKVANK